MLISEVFPTWSYWTAWSQCITPSKFWCMGVYNRTRSCFKTETEILEWEEIDGMTEEESMSHFGKDQLCGTDRVFYGWGGLMNGSLEARVEKNCHDRICSK